MGFPRHCVLAVALCGLAACGGDRAGPTATLEAYLRAVEAGDAEAAYLLMDESYRERVALETFRTRFERTREEARGRLTRAREAGWAVATEEATLDYGAPSRVRLIRTDGTWRIAEGVLEDYDQSTPRQALASFVRAMERRRYDVLLRFVPARLRADLSADRLRAHVEESEDVPAMLERLGRHLDDPIELVGERAVLRYEGFEFEMVREDGAWRVTDPD